MTFVVGLLEEEPSYWHVRFFHRSGPNLERGSCHPGNARSPVVWYQTVASIPCKIESRGGMSKRFVYSPANVLSKNEVSLSPLLLVFMEFTCDTKMFWDIMLNDTPPTWQLSCCVDVSSPSSIPHPPQDVDDVRSWVQDARDAPSRDPAGQQVSREKASAWSHLLRSHLFPVRKCAIPSGTDYDAVFPIL